MEWLKRLERGDGSALAELYDAHSNPWYHYVASILSSRSDAEDFLHNVMVRLVDLAGQAGLDQAGKLGVALRFFHPVDDAQSRNSVKGAAIVCYERHPVKETGRGDQQVFRRARCSGFVEADQQIAGALRYRLIDRNDLNS